VPLDFLKRRSAEQRDAPLGAPPIAIPEEAVAQDFQLKLTFGAKSSEGVRLTSDPGVLDDLPALVADFAKSDIEVLEPLPVELSGAAPVITHPGEASQWLEAHHERSPVARHALMVLESMDALDLAFDTFVCALLEGETDTAGYPDYAAIVGGVASHWDEATGDMIVRALVAWGGRGARGDSDRNATRLVNELFRNILASRFSLGMSQAERPVPAAGAGGLVCAHCGFASAHERAFYCPKCGMRLLRG
jgi:hypothetical protein